MAKHGLTSEGVEAWRRRLVPHVESGSMPGLVGLIASGDDVAVAAIGHKAFGDTEPIGREAIFRIASLTKPVTAVAALMMIDEGIVRLDDPVDDLLPELADRRVLRSVDAELDDTVPAERSITVEDLLTFRLGFGNLLAMPDAYPVLRAEQEAGLTTLGPPWPPHRLSSHEWMRRFGALPLMYQPGTQWLYNTGAQVLGVLIERATGHSLGEVFEQRIFGPLGMVDTGFHFTPEQRRRMTTAYQPDPETGEMSVLDEAGDDSFWCHPPAMENGAAWLLSTVDDFWAFARLLRNRGMHDGQRLLSEAVFAAMITDHITPQEQASMTLFLGEDHGWGLGVAVPAAGRSQVGIPGGFGWDGGTGTTWRTDLERDLTGILFTQRAMTSPEPPQSFADFWDGAYSALAG